MLSATTVAYYRLLQRLSVAGVKMARRLWAANPAKAATQLAPLVSNFQYVAATAAMESNEYTLAQAGTPVGAQFEVNPMAFAGWTNRGGSLLDLLEIPNRTRALLLSRGYEADYADRYGLASLERMVSTNIADAGTDAGIADMAARPRVGYVRVVGANACNLCIVLAGRFYWVEGFERHPHCLCVHQIAAYSNQADAQKWAIQQQRAVFDALSAEEQDRRFGAAEAEAIRQGADIGQVVNSKRSYFRGFDENGKRIWQSSVSKDGKTTRAGMGMGNTTDGHWRQGYAGQLLGSNRRFTIPEIARQAGGDRTVFRDLLASNGYIVERDANGYLTTPTQQPQTNNYAAANQRPPFNLADTPLFQALAKYR